MRQIEVFGDVACPFTHVGLRRFMAERSKRGSTVEFVVRAWPLERVNDAPLDPTAMAGKVDALRDSVAPDLFGGFDVGTFPVTSLPALQLEAEGYRSSQRQGERVSLALRDALFEHGRDLSDPDVIREIADAHGMPAPSRDEGLDHVLVDWHEGQARGVKGSPHFFIDDSDFFCPSLDISHNGDRLEISFDTAGFAEFVDRCFGDV